MSNQLVLLAILMLAVTYPSRAVPLLLPGVERLPSRALLYLRLVGPAMLASLAAANTFIVAGPGDTWMPHVGVEVLGVLVCLALTVWRRNLFLGLLAGIGLVALLRAAGLG
jgi:branched-subunit amino acid transport protein